MDILKMSLSLALCFAIGAPCLADSSSFFNLENGEKVRMYDKYGGYQGYYKKSGDKVREYSKTGSYNGYYKESGNKVRHYDKTGLYEGYYKK